MSVHEVLADGESTAQWVAQGGDFFGTIKQLTSCARCGISLPPKGRNEPRHAYQIGTPRMHFLCDECYDELPE